MESEFMKTYAEKETIAYSSKICARVREELNMSYFWFIWARNAKNPPMPKYTDSNGEVTEYFPGNSEEFLQFLKDNPDELERIKQEIQIQFYNKKSEFKTIGESVKTILNQTNQLI